MPIVFGSGDGIVTRGRTLVAVPVPGMLTRLLR